MFKQSLVVASIAVAAGSTAAFAAPAKTLDLAVLGTYQTGVFDEGAAEIVAYDPATMQLFVINADAKTVDILDISNPATPTKVGEIDVADHIADTGGVNSVAVHEGVVAVAVEHDDKQSNGWAAFFDTTGAYITHVPAGALPDMVTFTHNGQYVLVANEGEPSDDYTVDPEGSITVIDMRHGAANATAATAGFSAYNAGPFPANVRVSGPGASFAQDMEPEYIVTALDSKTAWVAMQENNAIAILDIASATVTDVVGLGYKNHMLPGQGLDASNRDDAINIANWPVMGMYMPDGMTSFTIKGETYLITANEGDGREYVYDDVSEEECEAAGHMYDDGDCFSHLDETRIKDLDLDPIAFPNGDDLQENENLGRLKAINTQGDTDGDGDFDMLYSYGARSITIWDADVNLVADTGDTIEQKTALALPDDFNATNDENDTFDDRSDDKGPEPEGVVVGKVQGRHYAFVGLERVGGIMVFDVTEPSEPAYVTYVNNRDFSVDAETPEAGDLGPEGLAFIKAEDSPTGGPLLVVGNEVSGTTTIYEISY